MTCSIDNCDKPTVAKGLCRTHYMRLRRAGDPNTVRKAGRPEDYLKAEFRLPFQNCGWSPRTFERYWTAYRRLDTLRGWQGVAENDPQSPFRRALTICTLPNGNVNVAKFSQLAEDWCALHMRRTLPNNCHLASNR
jgi:hypothetical protein